MFAGNGGSAADAQHLAGEFVSRFNFDRPGMAGLALTTDTSVLTAIGNDYGFEKVFSRQIEAVARPGDVLVALTTSGRSPNVLLAVDAARARGVVTVAMTGTRALETALVNACDHCIVVPATETPRVQEMHIVVGHALCGIVEDAIFQGRRE
jgi:D-sedoheptulose 7-phosphate isomerase